MKKAVGFMGRTRMSRNQIDTYGHYLIDVVVPVFDLCAPFLHEEMRIFATTEDGFLDVCMADVCRTVRKLWLTNLKNGYGDIVNLDDVRLVDGNAPAPLKLAVSVQETIKTGA